MNTKQTHVLLTLVLIILGLAASLAGWKIQNPTVMQVELPHLTISAAASLDKNLNNTEQAHYQLTVMRLLNY